MVRLLASLCVCLAVAITAGQAQACRLALALALDVSSSVDAREYALQRDGVAAALMSEDVTAAILSGEPTVWIAVYEWSGRRQSVVVQDWVLLDSPRVIAEVAARISGHRRSYSRFPTAMGYALGFGAGLLERGPACERRVIDVSGDGVTNDGFGPQLAYRHFPFDGVTVNGLAVLGADPGVVEHFEFEVLYGPDAFLETAQGYEGYERAMVRKLYREIENRVVGGLQQPARPGQEGPG
ncbi:MAG: DUF1194 domain-containing protein [Sagittula sp.]|uniref:DUF1194 domain-containing protein n=1 Tax=Sagittula sp. TaxID=2038081 RepID=UPI004058B391